MREQEEIVGEILDSANRAVEQMLLSESKKLIAADSSPIEKILAICFISFAATDNLFALSNNWKMPFSVFHPEIGKDLNDIRAQQWAPVSVWQQVKIGNYRADFVLRFEVKAGRCMYVAIECDGHAFHDLTKEQAERDRARDRYFQECDVSIFRFTGSEIWRDPAAAVLQVMSFCQKRSLP